MRTASGNMSNVYSEQRSDRGDRKGPLSMGRSPAPIRGDAGTAGRQPGSPLHVEQGHPDVSRGDFTIGQLARLSGVSTKAIRYYESVGLLPRPARSSNRYRRYGLADLNRLMLLRRTRLLGVPLSAAKPLLAGSSNARCIEVQQQLLALVDRRLVALDQEIAELQQFRASLEDYQRTLAACQPDENEAFSACLDMRCIDFLCETSDQEENNESLL